MTDRMFAELRPAKLDELTEDAYRRRRSADLARAFATPRPSRRLRRPFLLVAGTLAAGLAAAATVVAVSGESAAPPKAPQQRVVAQPVNARSFLLAAATTAMREPVGSGRYWYVRERTFQKVHNVPGEYLAQIKALTAEQAKAERDLKGDPERLAAAKKEFERKIKELKTSELSYTAYAADTRETWRAMEKGGQGRSVSNQDARVTFGSPQDEAAWRAAGSPELGDPKTRATADSTDRILSIDNPSLTLQNVRDLPTGEAGLRRELDALWKRSPNTAQVGKPAYLWQTGVDLMTAPIRPGTRSALFKILADQPGITSQGESSDALGRTGVALSAPSADGIDFRLIIDGDTAELLQYEVVEKGQPLLRVALEQLGWSDSSDQRPKG
ncbi:CU044_5270 family protein [Nonomuraea sp. NPDC050786]|uniref:CU044_5270 family protein n=1 Tax=Nonomuraea sp. NPDC050786 TaxID=3154840 RepID=UPI0033EB5971